MSVAIDPYLGGPADSQTDTVFSAGPAYAIGDAIGSLNEYLLQNVTPNYLDTIDKRVGGVGSFGHNYVYPVSFVNDTGSYAGPATEPAQQGTFLTIGGSWVLLAMAAVIIYLVAR